MDASPKGQVRLSLILFLASVIITAFFSIPSWLPVFGIELEWFGNALVVTFQRFLPLIAVIAGFIVGWVARGRQGRLSKRQQRKRDEALVDEIKNLPKPTKQLLKAFLEEGKLWGNIRDPEFKQLYQLGMIEGPSQFELLMGDNFVLTSYGGKFVKSHMKEIFND